MKNLKFDGTQLKYIAIIAMTIDHLTSPIKWYFISEGCY